MRKFRFPYVSNILLAVAIDCTFLCLPVLPAIATREQTGYCLLSPRLGINDTALRREFPDNDASLVIAYPTGVQHNLTEQTMSALNRSPLAEDSRLTLAKSKAGELLRKLSITDVDPAAISLAGTDSLPMAPETAELPHAFAVRIHDRLIIYLSPALREAIDSSDQLLAEVMDYFWQRAVHQLSAPDAEQRANFFKTSAEGISARHEFFIDAFLNKFKTKPAELSEISSLFGGIKDIAYTRALSAYIESKLENKTRSLPAAVNWENIDGTTPLLLQAASLGQIAVTTLYTILLNVGFYGASFYLLRENDRGDIEYCDAGWAGMQRKPWEEVWRVLPQRDEKYYAIQQTSSQDPILYISSRKDNPGTFTPWVLKDVFLYRFGKDSWISKTVSAFVDRFNGRTDQLSRIGLSFIQTIAPAWLARVDESLHVVIRDSRGKPAACILINNWRTGQPLFDRNSPQSTAEKKQALAIIARQAALAFETFSYKEQFAFDRTHFSENIRRLRQIISIHEEVFRSVHATKSSWVGVTGFASRTCSLIANLPQTPADADENRFSQILHAVVALGKLMHEPVYRQQNTNFIEDFEKTKIGPLNEPVQLLLAQSLQFAQTQEAADIAADQDRSPEPLPAPDAAAENRPADMANRLRQIADKNRAFATSVEEQRSLIQAQDELIAQNTRAVHEFLAAIQPLYDFLEQLVDFFPQEETVSAIRSETSDGAEVSAPGPAAVHSAVIGQAVADIACGLRFIAGAGELPPAVTDMIPPHLAASITAAIVNHYRTALNDILSAPLRPAEKKFLRAIPAEKLGTTFSAVKKYSTSLLNYHVRFLQAASSSSEESSADKLHIERVNLSEAITENITRFYQGVHRGAGALNFDISISPGCYAQTDIREVPLIMLNLLSNAIKYSPVGGTIRVMLEPRRLADGRMVIALSVRDQGIGIDPAKLHLIGKPYERLGRDRSTNIKGSGIGLSYVKSVVERMHGVFAAKSEGEGKGAEFIVYFPAAKQQGYPAKNPPLERRTAELPRRDSAVENSI
ncbi:MAG: ATP-binding protein [Candidatus Omnitrophica bacterium]|nr:ATP-binding protein [Candidatus Omnitrophota bacterium]